MYLICFSTGDWTQGLHSELYPITLVLFLILIKDFSNSLSSSRYTQTYDPSASSSQSVGIRFEPPCLVQPFFKKNYLKYFLISLLFIWSVGSSSLLFNYHIFMNFIVFLLLLIFTFTVWWSEMTLCMTNLLKFSNSFCGFTDYLLWRYFCVLLRWFYALFFKWSGLCSLGIVALQCCSPHLLLDL